MKEQRSRYFVGYAEVISFLYIDWSEITKQMLRKVRVAELHTDDSRRSSSRSSSSSSCVGVPYLSMTSSLGVWVTPSMTSLLRSRLPLQLAWLSVLFQFSFFELQFHLPLSWTSKYFLSVSVLLQLFFRLLSLHLQLQIVSKSVRTQNEQRQNLQLAIIQGGPKKTGLL